MIAEALQYTAPPT